MLRVRIGAASDAQGCGAEYSVNAVPLVYSADHVPPAGRFEPWRSPTTNEKPSLQHGTLRPKPPPISFSYCRRRLALARCLVHHQPRDGLTVLFLLRRVESVRLQIHGDCVYRVLHAKVFPLAVVIRVVLMKNGDRPAVAGNVDAPETRIEFDDVRSTGERQKRDGNVLVQIENGHQ